MTPATAERTGPDIQPAEPEAEATDEAHDEDPFDMGPGAQGIATQDDDAPDVEAYEPPEPNEQELALASDLYHKLDAEAGDMNGQAVVDHLIALTDVHDRFRTPELFGDSSDDRDRYHPAEVVQEIARFLVKPRTLPIEAPYRLLVFYFKDHEKWTSGGRKVYGQVKRFDGFFQYHLEGMKAAVLVNYHAWKAMNPRQKVAQVYRLLREIDKDGKKRVPDYAGYFDEPGLFGAGVHPETVTMAKAFVQDAAAHVGDPHQLSVLAGIYPED